MRWESSNVLDRVFPFVASLWLLFMVLATVVLVALSVVLFTDGTRNALAVIVARPCHLGRLVIPRGIQASSMLSRRDSHKCIPSLRGIHTPLWQAGGVSRDIYGSLRTIPRSAVQP